jgi:16S rRNA (cytosine967-C5)-methyltransferase
LSRELAFGVVRREITLDVLLARLVRRSMSDLEPPLRSILHLGLYQLVFADQIPPHAAVHETVELAKTAGRLRWAGFVNGVLRAATRLCTDQFSAESSREAVPVGTGRFRLLSEPVFPEPDADFLGYFRNAYGYPEWLARRWTQRWPPIVLHRIGQWQRSPAPVFVRVNVLRTTRDDLLKQFLDAGLDASPAESPEAIRVSSGGRIEGWPGFDAGLFSVQDLSAMHAARRLAPQPGERILDLCAAPGGKACHLAELMGDVGEILAVDVVPSRLDRIVDNVRRLGTTTVHALLAAEDGHDLPRGPFDRVLADVPCSNTGVLGRRPEVLHHLTPNLITELSRLQLELLHRAAQRVRPGGRVLYSTCSIEAEEDEQVVQTFLDQRPQFRLVEASLLLPGDPADGGYQALLERTA